MACGRLAKDVQYLQRHIDKQTNGQAKVTEVDDNLEFLLLNLMPNDGLYKGAKLKFKITFPEYYPDEVPRVMCLDDVYHPNIDTSEGSMEEGDTNVCVSLLDEWESSMGLDHVVMAVLFLLYNPNPGDALSPYFDGTMAQEDLEENIRKALHGETIEGISWPCLLEEKEDSGSGEKGEQKDDEHPNGSPSGDNEQGEDSCREGLNVNVGEIGENSTATVSTSLSDSGSKDADGEDVSNAASTSNISTAVLNHHNSTLVDVIAQTFKDTPVIFLDAADRECKNSDAKCYGDSLGIGRLFSCTSCRVSRIKALFSCFHRRDAGIQFQATNAGVLSDLGDCEVD